MEQTLTPQRRDELLAALKTRFEQNMARHPGAAWADVQARLEGAPEKLWSLGEMERTGGEPDVVAWGEAAGACTFYDCAPESPAGRRNLCYDAAALEKRKANKPGGSAVEAAEAMGIALLTEEQYRALQQLGAFDTKTSSWLQTPAEVRKHGGAIFGDRRYGHVFIYHNGADAYYGVRGFRGALTV